MAHTYFLYQIELGYDFILFFLIQRSHMELDEIRANQSLIDVMWTSR